MYVWCMYVCMYVSRIVYACMCVCMYVCVCVCMYVCKYECICTYRQHRGPHISPFSHRHHRRHHRHHHFRCFSQGVASDVALWHCSVRLASESRLWTQNWTNRDHLLAAILMLSKQNTNALLCNNVILWLIAVLHELHQKLFMMLSLKAKSRKAPLWGLVIINLFSVAELIGVNPGGIGGRNT